jgi:cell division protein FtsZ
VKTEPKPEKIVMTLGVDGDEKKMYQQQALKLEDKDPFAPRISDNSVPHIEEAEVLQPSWMENRESLELMELHIPVENQPAIVKHQPASEEPTIHFELTPDITGPVPPIEQPVINEVPAELDFKLTETSMMNNEQTSSNNDKHTFLAKPSNIYAQIPDQKPVAVNYEQTKPVQPEPLETTPAAKPVEEEPEFEMKLVEREEDPGTADKVRLQTKLDHSSTPAEEPAPLDDAGDQKRRAAERIQKLRNLSFNMNSADPNNEFDSVPAYVRRNMELFGSTLTSVENFYSKYTVNKDDNSDQANISSINTFLDGKKPD